MINYYSAYIDPDFAGYQKTWETAHKDELAAMATKFKANRRAFRTARRELMKKHPMKQTPLTVLARHVEHCAKVAGWDHVGMGADWDGVGALPEGIRHCGDTVKLTALLLARAACSLTMVVASGRRRCTQPGGEDSATDKQQEDSAHPAR